MTTALAWMCSVWGLLLWLYALRRLCPSAPDEPEWEWRADLPLALTLGVGFGLVTDFHMARYFHCGYPLTASDFQQYCASVGAVMHGQWSMLVAQRSPFEALLPGLLARQFGVMGGLALAALIAQCVTGGALYAWARVVGGRSAGVAAVLIAAAMEPVVVLARTVTFYPQSVATTFLSAVAIAGALRYRTWPSLLGVGATAGLVLLWDVRGFFQGGLAISVGLALVPFTPGDCGWRRRLGLALPRAALVLTPVVVSWHLAPLLTVHDALGLGRQTAFLLNDMLGIPAESDTSLDVLWGRTPLREVPAGLMAVQQMLTRLPAVPAHGGGGAVVQILPWLGPVAAGLTGFLLRWFRDPARVAALLVPGLPIAASLYTAVRYLGMIRYIEMGFPVLAIAVAVGVGAALRGAGPGGAGPGGRAGLVPSRFHLALLTTLGLLLVLGIVPSWLSPVAEWRHPIGADTLPEAVFGPASASLPPDRCYSYLDARDAEVSGWFQSP